MAFVSGYDTQYVCKECKKNCSIEFAKQMGINIYVEIGYRHVLDGYMFHNGIPCPCKNNGKLLNRGDVTKEVLQIIDKDRNGYF